jgi:hypothetical protein
MVVAVSEIIDIYSENDTTHEKEPVRQNAKFVMLL